jgi:hypothetical protein
MKKYAWILLGIAVGIAAAYFGLTLAVQRTTAQSLLPLQQTNNVLQTQVADFLHPTPTILPDPVTVVNAVRSLARLETIEFAVEKVITAETGQGTFGSLFGDKLLFVAHGKVIGGVDLADLAAADLSVSGGLLTARMPAPEIFSAALDNEKSYVFNRQTGILTHGSPDLETQARRAAEQEIYAAALQDGILDLARANAESFLRRLFRQLGYSDVLFLWPEPTPSPL